MMCRFYSEGGKLCPNTLVRAWRFEFDDEAINNEAPAVVFLHVYVLVVNSGHLFKKITRTSTHWKVRVFNDSNAATASLLL